MGSRTKFCTGWRLLSLEVQRPKILSFYNASPAGIQQCHWTSASCQYEYPPHSDSSDVLQISRESTILSFHNHLYYVFDDFFPLFRHANIAISIDIPLSCFTPNTSTSTDGPGSGGSSPSPMGTPTHTCPGSHCAATRAARLTLLECVDEIKY